jgi:phosphatidylglycerophosphatase GEP4
MVQSFNWPAIRLTARILVGKPALALPHIEVKTIRDINFHKLRAAGFEGVVFDKDNTLTEPYVDTLEPSLAEALREAREAFDGKVAVLSNSAGTPDDPGYAVADRLEQALSMPVLRRAKKKPEGFESVHAHFGTQLDPSSLVMVGDRYLTDVAFGNKHGMLCVRTCQLTSRGDNPVARAMLFFEIFLVALFRCLRIKPERHRLSTAALACVRSRRGPQASRPHDS